MLLLTEFLFMGSCLWYKMEIRTIEDCLKFRLLRKIEPNQEKSNKSFKLAKKNLSDAELFLKESREIYIEITIM